MPIFNFSSYYLNKSLSDVKVVITVPDDDVVLGRKQAEQLPGHGIVLANVSPLFKAQIEQQDAKHAQITLDVDMDQVAAAHALMKYVYTGILPEYDHCPEQEPLLVHMLHLAQRYEVQDCISACLDALVAIQQLQPRTVHLVYSLISETSDQINVTSLLQHCSNHLQQQFGNLEYAVTDGRLLNALHNLPHSALLALLRDERTQAVSENTVLAAVQSWLAHQPSHVDHQQREQLAGAVRIPHLEPMYLATVVPRIPWLVEVLGPQGMAIAAGVCKGMYDVHAQPVLSDPHTCGHLTTAWLKGVRRQPDSYMLDNDEPGITIQWTLPLARVREAFEAACATAAAATAPMQGGDTAAPAAAGSGRWYAGSSAAGSGSSWHQGWGSSGAAAVKSAAAAAVSLGTSVFRGRKRSLQERGQQQVIRDTAASPTAGRAPQSDTDLLEGCNTARKQQRRCASAGMRGSAHTLCAVAADDVAPAALSSDGGGDGAIQQGLEPGQEAPSSQHHSIKSHSQEVTFAGYTWRLVLYFVAKPKQDGVAGDSNQAAAAVNTAVMAKLNHRQQIHAGTAAPSAAANSPQPQQQLQQHRKSAKAGSRRKILHAASAAAGCAASVDEDTAGFAPWVHQDLGSLQTPWGSKRGRRAAAAVAQQGSGPDSWLPAAIPEGGQLAVAAAAAVRLPGELSPAAAAAAAGDDPDMTDSGEDDAYSWEWQARLAIEAWPCIALQPGVSVAAFSATLAVKMSGGGGLQSGAIAGGRQLSASLAAANGGSGSQRESGRPSSGQQQVRQPCSRRLTTNGGSGGLSSRPLASQVDAAAAGTAMRAPRSSSTHIAAGNAEGAAGGLTALQALTRRHSGGPTKRAAAVAANHRIQLQRQAGHVLAGSDGGRGGPEHHDEVIVDDSSDADDEQEVGDRHAAGTAAYAADGGGFQTEGGATPSSTNRSTSYGSDEEGISEETTTSEKENRATNAGGATHDAGKGRKKAHAAASQGTDQQQGCSWMMRTMPQGRHVKSSKCDTGYSNFFDITLQQGPWDESAWRQYVQPGGVLVVKGTIWNVR